MTRYRQRLAAIALADCFTRGERVMEQEEVNGAVEAAMLIYQLTERQMRAPLRLVKYMIGRIERRNAAEAALLRMPVVSLARH